MLAESGHQSEKAELLCLRCSFCWELWFSPGREQEGAKEQRREGGFAAERFWTWTVWGWRKPWCSRTGRILRTGLGDAIWCCLQNGIQCNPPPPTWLPHFIKVCHFHKCVVWIGFVFFVGGWCWWWRGWSCMGTSKGTQSGTEIPLGEMGVQSWN